MFTMQCNIIITQKYKIIACYEQPIPVPLQVPSLCMPKSGQLPVCGGIQSHEHIGKLTT